MAESTSELGLAIDGLLAQQIAMNISALERSTGRTFTDAERDEITRETHRAWRWTFLVSGLRHPRVVEIVSEITDAGAAKFEAAAVALSA